MLRIKRWRRCARLIKNLNKEYNLNKTNNIQYTVSDIIPNPIWYEMENDTQKLSKEIYA